MFRELSKIECNEVRDWFFNHGIDAREAGHRLALLEYLAEKENRPVIDIHRELSISK